MKISLKVQQWIVTALTLILLFLVIVDSAFWVVRCDSTQDHTYKISKVTKKTLKELDEPVSVAFYLSNKVLQQRPFAQITVDLLNEMANVSHKNLRLHVIRLTSKNLDKYQSELQGLQPWQLQMSDGKSSASVNFVYSGLVIQYKEKQSVIPVLREYNYQELEYELISRIRQLAYDYRLKIGLINATGRPETPPRSQNDLIQMGYNALVEQSTQLYENFSFEPIALGEKIDSQFGAVVVVGADLVDETQVLIFDQYLMRGGSLFFAAEQGPLRVDPSNQYNPITVESLSQNPLFGFFKHFGVEFESGKLMDLNARQTLVQTAPGKLSIVPVVFQPRMVAVNKSYPFANHFNGVTLYWPEALKITDFSKAETPASDSPEAVSEEAAPAPVASPSKASASAPHPTVDILLSSSKKSALAPVAYPQMLWNPSDGFSLYNSTAAAAQKSYPVAVHVHGNLSSYFKGKPLPRRAGEDALFSDLVESTDEGQWMLLSDTECLSDFLLAEGQESLVQNLLALRDMTEYLGGDKELLKVRTKVPGVRLLTDNAKIVNAVSIVSMVVTLGVLPLFLIVFAIARLVVRMKKTK